MAHYLLLSVVYVVCSFSLCRVTDASQSFDGESDSDNIRPECTICTNSERCLTSSCYVYFDESSLLALYLNDSCRGNNNVTAIIPPDENHTVSLEDARQTCGGYSLVHTFSCLVSMPTNLCQFPATKKINFYGNRLKKFPNLSCLTELVILDLRSNSIRTVPRDAFKGLTKLRDILLDFNQIVHVDPFAFSTPLPQLNKVDLSYNKLEAAEPWFMNIYHKFCEFNLNNNLIKRFSNEQGFSFASLSKKRAGPGYVDFSKNKFSLIPSAQLKQFGVRSFGDLARVLSWGFDFRDNPIACDCSVYELLRVGRELLLVIKRDYFNVTCDSPPDLRGKYVVDVPLDKLVCNITIGCPDNCTCQDRPSKGYVYVDCAGAGLTRLPDVMPLEKQLNVTLANNSIEVLEARDYLERVVNLDITYNGLKEVEAEALRFLRNVQKLDLRGNQIAYLPDTLQILPSSAVTIDPYTLSCDCNMLWFSSWKLLYVETRDKGDNFVRSDGDQPPETEADIFCLLRDGKYIPMTEATKERLGCIKAITPLPLIVAVAIVASIVLCGIALAAIFRYEILVLCHMFMSIANKQQKTQVLPHEKDTGKDKKDRQQQRHDAHGYTHDVYISCSDSDTDLDWVIHRLLPMLDQRGVKSYLLVRDSPPGVVAVDEAVKNIRDSHVVLVVLSAEYAASATCLFQFSQAYNFTLGRSAGESVRKDRRRLLVLEVDGGARYGHVGEPHLKAMLRMRMTLCGDNPRDMERVAQTISDI